MSLEPFRGWVPMAGGAPQERSALFDAPSGNLRFADWLYRSKAASVIWLVARLWLGYEWLNAGYQKLWGRRTPGSGTTVVPR